MNQHTRDPQRVAAAKAVLTRFFSPGKASTHGKGVWNGEISLEAMRFQIDNPEAINQGTTNTCGPAAFLYALAYYRPEQYARIMGELYVYGKTTLGDMTLMPSRAILSSWVDNGEVEFIDWMPLVSIKNSTTPDYDHMKDQIAGMTFPGEIAKWLKRAGWQVQRHSAYLFKENITDLRRASVSFNSGHVVFLFVKAKSISNKVKKSPWWGVDHWVTLTSPVKVRKDRHSPWRPIQGLPNVSDTDLLHYQIQFTIVSWGENMTIGTGQPSTGATDNVKQWLHYYYGYIAAKPPV